MSDQYLSEIRIMAFLFAPKGWALCNGQTLPINQNSALFSLIGTTYGGNGINTFMLPNLQGQVPMHFGDGFNLGQALGEATHTLTVAEMPAHNHAMMATAASGATQAPSSSVYPAEGASTNVSPAAPVNLYGTANPTLNFASTAIGNTGGGQAHENRQPYLVLNFCIALQGILPSRS